MEQRIFIVFLVGIIFAAHADLLQQIMTTNSFLVKYDQDLDNAVPFREFRESIKVLEFMAKEYNGACKDDIVRATSLSYSATDNYFRATNEIFEWCVKAKTIFGYMLEYQSDRSLSNSMWELIVKTLKDGLKALNKSLSILDQVKDDLTKVYGVLSPMSNKLENELEQLKRD